MNDKPIGKFKNVRDRRLWQGYWNRLLELLRVRRSRHGVVADVEITDPYYKALVTDGKFKAISVGFFPRQ